MALHPRFRGSAAPGPALWSERRFHHTLSREDAPFVISLTRFATKRIQRLFTGSAPNTGADLNEGIFLYLSSDGMAAWLLFLPPVGNGAALTTEQLGQALARRGVIYGVDKHLLEQLPTQPQRYFRLFRIAGGALPVPGEDGSIVGHYPRTVQADLPVDELAQADYETLRLVQDIRQGDVICEILPPTQGRPGNTVTGRLLPAKPGNPAQAPQGRNTVLSEDGRFLLTARDGHVEYTGRSFQVKPVLDIAGDVSGDTGIVNFLGDIHIHGDVFRGATIRAMGSIQIDGAVEDCSIEAGQDLVVSSGVQGQDHGVIQAHRSVYAKYLEHCRVYAQESVQSDCVIDCEVYSNGTVRVRTGRGVIIGGTIRAAQEVDAATVGSKAERLTNIILGGMPCEDLERRQIQAEVEAAEAALQALESTPECPDRNQALSKQRMGLYVAQMKLKRLENSAEHLPPSPDQDHRRLNCGAVYPGTVVTVDHASYRVSRVMQECAIGLKNGLVGPIRFSEKEASSLDPPHAK
ncbi:DUF342 domain-containing protein [Intestinimonas timonensis]|uniref:DUF342 domain-containing protein n=1 Tax=Intestinimonas timonensis TaxID=1689270 RepID=UPI001030A204|nr:FapA family protein [Intestinimonas timonensis]